MTTERSQEHLDAIVLRLLAGREVSEVVANLRRSSPFFAETLRTVQFQETKMTIVPIPTPTLAPRSIMDAVVVSLAINGMNAILRAQELDLFERVCSSFLKEHAVVFVRYACNVFSQDVNVTDGGNLLVQLDVQAVLSDDLQQFAEHPEVIEFLRGVVLDAFANNPGALSSKLQDARSTTTMFQDIQLIQQERSVEPRQTPPTVDTVSVGTANPVPTLKFIPLTTMTTSPLARPQPSLAPTPSTRRDLLPSVAPTSSAPVVSAMTLWPSHVADDLHTLLPSLGPTTTALHIGNQNSGGAGSPMVSPTKAPKSSKGTDKPKKKRQRRLNSRRKERRAHS